MSNTRDKVKYIEAKLEDLLEGPINKTPVDISKGVERLYGVSRQTFLKAVRNLKSRGYPVYRTRVRHYSEDECNTWMSLMVICPKGRRRKDVF